MFGCGFAVPSGVDAHAYQNNKLLAPGIVSHWMFMSSPSYVRGAAPEALPGATSLPLAQNRSAKGHKEGSDLSRCRVQELGGRAETGETDDN